MFYLEDKSSALPCSFARVYSEIINTKKNLSTDLFTAGRPKEDVLRKDFPLSITKGLQLHIRE